MTNCPAQLLELTESPCQLTVTTPPQLSLVVTLLVFGAGTWLAQTHRQGGRTCDARRVDIVDRDGLRAGSAIAALVRRPVSPADDKLTDAITRTDRVSLPLTVTAPPQLSPVVTLLVFGWEPGWRNPP